MFRCVLLLIACVALIVSEPVAAQDTATKKKLPQNKIGPTHANVSYGDHKMNVIDFWQAQGDGPRPLLVFIHGGGWIGGDKKRRDADVKPFLDKGISYAAINYRLTGEAPLPAPVHDAARAIQFIRSKAEEWNIQKDRIALTGGSAGACTSMWILCHDDLANPQSADPVARESTRVTAAAVAGGQTSIDPKVIEPWLGPMVLKHNMINMAVGEQKIEDALKNYEKHRELYREFSPYNHVSKDDPPLLMTYGNNMKLPSESAGHGIHHPVYGVKMKEKADSVGQECHLIIKGVSGSKDFNSANEFLIAKLLAK
jgi:arylformamidase